MSDSFQGGYWEDPETGETLVTAPEGLSEQDLQALLEALIQQNPDIGMAQGRMPYKSQPIPTQRQRSPEEQAIIDMLFEVGQ